MLVVATMLRIPVQPGRTKLSFTERLKDIDLIGASVLVPAVVCLLLALQWGGATYPWNNSRIIGLFVGFGCLILIFIYIQIRLGDRATLPPRILRQRTVAFMSTFGFFFGAGFFVLVFYLPIYFQSVKGVSATRSGIEILPLMLSAVLASIITGGLITVFGQYAPFLIASAAMSAIGVGLLTTFSVNTSFSHWFGYQVLTGLGVGAGFQVPLMAVQTVLPLEDIPIGTACVIFTPTLGGSLFISVAQTVFQNGVIKGTEKFVPSLDPHMLLEVGATQIRQLLVKLGITDQLPAVLNAYMVGLVDVYRVSLGCGVAAFAATLFVEWKNVKEEDAKRKKAGVQVPVV